MKHLALVLATSSSGSSAPLDKALIPNPNPHLSHFFKPILSLPIAMFGSQFLPSSRSQANASPRWNRAEDKQFELALVKYPEGTLERWASVASEIPGKSPQDVSEHYRRLAEDVTAIDAGRVPLPQYEDADGGSEEESLLQSRKRDERKRGIPWTPEEHRKFLDGLKKYGKGDWRNIARKAVKTRTSTQVASHAQKFFNRQASANKETKRKSIHDITEP